MHRVMINACECALNNWIVCLIINTIFSISLYSVNYDQEDLLCILLTVSPFDCMDLLELRY